MTAADEPIRVVHGRRSVEIAARLDRREAEALALELRSLAARYGLGAPSVRVASRPVRARRKRASSGQ